MIEAQHALEDQNIRFKLNEAEHGKDTTQALREIRRTNGDLHSHACHSSLGGALRRRLVFTDQELVFYEKRLK